MPAPILSIIIVHYQIEPILFACLKSIEATTTKVTFEMIVVDNGSRLGFARRLKKKFPQVRYFQATHNLGYGEGNNWGAKQARGKLLFFLNPDTLLLDHCLDHLTAFYLLQPRCGIVAPTLLHPNRTPFKQQGSLTLTPLRAIAAHSIFHTVWPGNPWAAKFWLGKVDQNRNRQVQVVPGTALVISSRLFQKVGGFDPEFFLYFEEYDLCRRVLAAKKEIWMLGGARLIHAWEATTASVSTREIYKNSFHYYLTKHYGRRWGNLTFMMTQISKYHILMISVLLTLIFWLIYAN